MVKRLPFIKNVCKLHNFDQVTLSRNKKISCEIKKSIDESLSKCQKKKKIIPYEIIKPLVNYMRFVKLYNT